jgi:aryl sulfotransferase
VSETVERRVERDYRSIVSDNRRWEHFTHRSGDIVVCTSPKCGTTWMQTIVATLLFPLGQPQGTVMERSPWIDARFFPIEEIVARLEAQTHRRSIKTHTPADGIPWWTDASYIVVVRDGLDAFMSFLNHVSNMRQDVLRELAATASADGIELGGRLPVDDVHAAFASWLEPPGVWFEHLLSFWPHRGEPNVLFVHFEDLKADLDGEMRRVAAFLDLDIGESLWPKLTEQCTFTSMKQRSAEINDFDRLFIGGADTFLYKGTNGRWREVLTADEVAAFDEQSARRLPPDANAWANRHHMPT